MNTTKSRSVSVLGGVALLVFVAAGRPASAQVGTSGLDPYRHTYDPEHGYVPYAGNYGYGGLGYGGGMTPAMGAGIGAGAAAAGVGQAAAGIGQGQLSHAQAQEAHQQATTQFLQNENLAQQTAMETSARRQTATQQWDESQKKQVEAQAALYNRTLQQMAAAQRLTAAQYDVGRGVLHWPFVLREPQYTDLRQKIDQLYDARTPQDSGLNSSTFDAIETSCQQLQALVNEEVKKGLPVNDFVTAKHFISSIEYEARFPVKATTVASAATK